MSILGNDLLLAGTDEGYNLTRSLRFRSSASAHLGRTFSTGNRKTWTLSFWVKRGSLGSNQNILVSGPANTTDATFANIGFSSANAFTFTAYSVAWRTTTQVFRDPSAWYHIVVTWDTTQATAADRVKIYVNGSQVTAFSSTFDPSLNFDGAVNQAAATYISLAHLSYGYFDGYLTEVNFIDGQALTPSSFGETDTITGVWKPKRYAGTYGTNGFYLPFTDNSALTTSSNVGIGKDFSGNGNYWVTNNISITAGTTYDSMTDVPTLTSATAANFAVLNPLNAAATLNDGNMNARVTGTGGNYSVSSTIALSSGLIYFETIPYVFSLVNGQIGEFGICYATANLQAVGTRITNSGIGVGFGFGQGSSTWFSRNFGTATNLTGLSGFTTTTVAMVAVNLTTGNIWVGKDGVWYNSGNPATGANPTITGIPTAQYAIGITAYQDTGLAVFQAINFGQRPFAYTPPTGYVALNTFNLPTSTIVKGNTVMDATLFTGAGAAQSIVNAGGFKPDLVWEKNRSNVNSWLLYTSSLGVGKYLQTDTTGAEGTLASSLTSFDATGFSLGNAGGAVNATSNLFVAYQWQAGQGTTSTNTNGTITSTVSVNASAGFSVVTFSTSAGYTSGTVGHGLGVAPAMYIVKNRNGSSNINWITYHQSVGNTAALYLNATNAAVTSSTFWNNTSPTSSVFSVAGNLYPSSDMVAYCWTPIAGYSAFGSYTGNGSTDGPFVYTGFRPKWIMVKDTSAGSGQWIIWDSTRDTYNIVGNELFANSSSAETANGADLDFLSNGFKPRRSATNFNANGVNYIYISFASNPFKNSLAF